MEINEPENEKTIGKINKTKCCFFKKKINKIDKPLAAFTKEKNRKNTNTENQKWMRRSYNGCHKNIKDYTRVLMKDICPLIQKPKRNEQIPTSVQPS